MNIIPLTAIIITAALTSNLVASKPCENRCKEGTDFVKRHILSDHSLGERSPRGKWTVYLKDKQLLGREPVQSFIKETKETVQQICGDSGRQLRGNLCISKSPMVVYHVQSTNKEVTNVKERRHNVIVACNLIGRTGNHCGPVHYQAYNNERPGDTPCRSRF